MKTNNDNPIELIIDEFESNLSEEGKMQLQKWVDSNPENQKLYDEFHSVKNSLSLLDLYKNLDQDSSWNKLEQKINFSEEQDPGSVSNINRNYKLWWMSAAAILICSISVIAYQLFNTREMTISTVAMQQKQHKLPDGSVITMNGNTVIKYNESGFDKNRELTLIKGEAFFDVVHDPGKVFQIGMGDLRVTDIGTSFIIKRSDIETIVIVSSGKVAFEDISSNKRFILGPGEKGVFVAKTKNITAAANPDTNFKAWVDKKFSFKNSPMREVVKELEEAYGSRVILKDDILKKRTLTATLNYQTIDSALLVIAASLQLEIEKQPDHYELVAK